MYKMGWDKYIKGYHLEDLTALKTQLNELTKKQIGKLKVSKHKALKLKEKELKATIRKFWKLDRKVIRKDLKKVVHQIKYVIKFGVTRHQASDIQQLLITLKHAGNTLARYRTLVGDTTLPDLIKYFEDKLAHPRTIEKSRWQQNITNVNDYIIKYLEEDRSRAWSTSQLSEHIKFHENIRLTASTLKQNYLPQIRQYNYSAAHHFDVGIGRWFFKEPEIKNNWP